MSHGEYLYLLGEKTTLERMLDETPEAGGEPTRVKLTFKGRPVIGSHGIFAEFGMKAVNSFTESVAAMAASLTGPLAPVGPIPNRDQHQLLITSTTLGSFGFELEEHNPGQLSLGETSAVARALNQTQRLLRGTLGTDDELAESAADTDPRVLDKVRGFLQTLVDNEAICTVQLGDSRVSFTDVGQVRTSLDRLSQENFREEQQELIGEFLGVLPRSRDFEFKLAGSEQVIRGKIAPAIDDPEALNQELHRPIRIMVMVTRIGTGRPRYLLLQPPTTATRV